ncbi:MAG: hypothetical protein VZS44_05040 [Bacilli bacterium]|nr:hypothetical protein [Bacilli bacterium]
MNYDKKEKASEILDKMQKKGTVLSLPSREIERLFNGYYYGIFDEEQHLKNTWAVVESLGNGKFNVCFIPAYKSPNYNKPYMFNGVKITIKSDKQKKCKIEYTDKSGKKKTIHPSLNIDSLVMHGIDFYNGRFKDCIKHYQSEFDKYHNPFNYMKDGDIYKVSSMANDYYIRYFNKSYEIAVIPKIREEDYEYEQDNRTVRKQAIKYMGYDGIGITYDGFSNHWAEPECNYYSLILPNGKTMKFSSMIEKNKNNLDTDLLIENLSEKKWQDILDAAKKDCRAKNSAMIQTKPLKDFINGISDASQNLMEKIYYYSSSYYTFSSTGPSEGRRNFESKSEKLSLELKDLITLFKDLAEDNQGVFTGQEQLEEVKELYNEIYGKKIEKHSNLVDKVSDFSNKLELVYKQFERETKDSYKPEIKYLSSKTSNYWENSSTTDEYIYNPFNQLKKGITLYKEKIDVQIDLYNRRMATIPNELSNSDNREIVVEEELSENEQQIERWIDGQENAKPQKGFMKAISNLTKKIFGTPSSLKGRGM